MTGCQTDLKIRKHGSACQLGKRTQFRRRVSPTSIGSLSVNRSSVRVGRKDLHVKKYCSTFIRPRHRVNVVHRLLRFPLRGIFPLGLILLRNLPARVTPRWSVSDRGERTAKAMATSKRTRFATSSEKGKSNELSQKKRAIVLGDQR